MQSTYLRWGLVIVLVLAIGIGWMVWSDRSQPVGGTATPTPLEQSEADVTADWKTFTNTTYNYSFRYPSDLEFIEEYMPLEDSDQVALAHQPGTADYEVRFGVKTVYVGYLDNLPTVKTALAAGNLEQFATYLWDSNKNDVNPETKGRTVSDLQKKQIGDHEVYTFTVTDKLTIGKGEANNQDGSINYVLNGWQDFKREQQIMVLKNSNRFFIVYYPAAYAEGEEILRSLTF